MLNLVVEEQNGKGSEREREREKKCRAVPRDDKWPCPLMGASGERCGPQCAEKQAEIVHETVCLIMKHRGRCILQDIKESSGVKDLRNARLLLSKTTFSP